MSVQWSDDERAAVVEGGGGFLEDWQADLILDALAPFVAAREAQAWDHGFATGKSRAMRYMSDEPSLSLDAPNPHRIAQDAP